MTTSHLSIPSPRLHPMARAALILLGGAVIATALNALVALIGVAAGAPADYAPLKFPVYTAFTVLGFAAGWAGWVIVSRRARDPRRVLAVLVPTVLLLSFVPDVVLLVTRFIPGTTTAAAVALMVMHVVVVAVAVPAFVLASASRRPQAADRRASVAGAVPAGN